jgi:hypothetical protein
MKSLRDARLVVISREEERKVMRFKYFRPAHKVLIPDIRVALKEEKKFALLTPIKDFIEGYLAGIGLDPDPKIRKKILTAFSNEIITIIGAFSSEEADTSDSDELRRKIYVTVAKNVLNREEFRAIPQTE